MDSLIILLWLHYHSDSGRLACCYRYGGKTVLGLGVVVTAALTLLTPLAARISFGALIGLRILEGLFEVNVECLLNYSVYFYRV